jgi:flagellar biosynthetic protein FliO
VENTSFGYLLLKTAGVLGFIILLMLGTLFFVKKYFPRLIPRYGGTGRIKVIEKYMLSPKHSLVLVEIDGLKFVVGIGPQNITLKEGWSSLEMKISESDEDNKVKP